MQCCVCEVIGPSIHICCPEGERICASCGMSGMIGDSYQCQVCYECITPQQSLELIKKCQIMYKNNVSFQSRRGQNQRGQNLEIEQTMKKPNNSRNQTGYQGQGDEEAYRGYHYPSFPNSQMGMPYIPQPYNMPYPPNYQQWQGYGYHMPYNPQYGPPKPWNNENGPQNKQFPRNKGQNQEQSYHYNFSELKNYSQTNIFPCNEPINQERISDVPHHFCDGQINSRAETKNKTTEGMDDEYTLRNRSSLRMNRSNSLNSFSLKR